jgi:hypothetical protein
MNDRRKAKIIIFQYERIDLNIRGTKKPIGINITIFKIIFKIIFLCAMILYEDIEVRKLKGIRTGSLNEPIVPKAIFILKIKLIKNISKKRLK